MNAIQKSYLSQSLTNDEDQEDLSKTSSCRQKVKQYFRYFSFGKYQTPLYFRQQDQFSSVLSGVISNLFVIGMITIALFIFIPVFKKQSYSLKVNGYDTEKIISNSDDSTTFYTCPECISLTLEDSITLINET